MTATHPPPPSTRAPEAHLNRARMFNESFDLPDRQSDMVLSLVRAMNRGDQAGARDVARRLAESMVPETARGLVLSFPAAAK